MSKVAIYVVAVWRIPPIESKTIKRFERSGLAAILKVETGQWFVSKLDDDDQWHIDAVFGPNDLTLKNNGFGERGGDYSEYVIEKLRKDISDALDTYVERKGATTMTAEWATA